MKYLELVTHHNTQIITTSELKQHLRITFDDDDAYIVELEKAAVQRLEEYCNIYLLPTVLYQYGFNINELNTLLKSSMLAESGADPVIAEPKVQAFVGGTWVTQATGIEFIYQVQPPRVYVSSNAALLTPDDVRQKWRVNFTCGYKTAELIPIPIKQAIKIMVSDMYENRQSVIVGKIVSMIPKTAQYLMNPYKIQTL
tara:strand:+ start:136 stop:729 length:594 start_codon:yes stop_codon:yes gene_type:complete